MRDKGRACFKIFISLARSHSKVSRALPICSTDVASGVCWNAAAVDYYSEDDETDTGDDLHNAEGEFDLFDNQLARHIYTQGLGDSFSGWNLPRRTPSHQRIE